MIPSIQIPAHGCDNTACFCTGACMGMYNPNEAHRSFTWSYPIAGVVDSISVVIDGIEYEPIPFDELKEQQRETI